MHSRAALVSLAVLPVALALSGCRVHTSGDKHSNVDIATPFGDMHVKSDSATIGQRTGIAIYPGSTPRLRHHGDDHDNGAADVNFNFGKFQMHILAASYTTGDPTDKVEAFYRNDLHQRFGDVITCHGSQPVGQPTRTADGLTCSSKKSNRGYEFGSSDDIELRTGSPERQHLVTVKSEDGQTVIGLIALQLPHDVTAGDSGDSE